MLRSSSRNQELQGSQSSNSDTSVGNGSQPTSRKRKHCDINQTEPSESRKRLATGSRASTEGGRNSRDGNQPGPSRDPTHNPNPPSLASSCTHHAKPARDLCDCNGLCSMPVIMNSNGSVNHSNFTNFHLHPSLVAASSRQEQPPNQVIPIFLERQPPPVVNTRQSSLRHSPIDSSSRGTNGITSLPHTAIPNSSHRYIQERASHLRCSICFPPIALPQALLTVPSTEARAAARRLDPLLQGVSSSFRSNYDNPLSQTQPREPRLPETPMQLVNAPHSALPNLLSLGQFPTNQLFADINGNHIPAPSRIPFQEIEPFSMAMRSTRSLANRHMFSNFTQGMPQFSASWTEQYSSSDLENRIVLMPQQMSSDVVLPSFDVQNYEALLGLAQQLAETRPKGLSKNELDQLLIFHYNSEANRSDMTSCVICMSDFENRQRIRVLRCKHQFHSKCVDKWLKTNRTCPMCRADAVEVKKTPRKRKSRDI